VEQQAAAAVVVVVVVTGEGRARTAATREDLATHIGHAASAPAAAAGRDGE